MFSTVPRTVIYCSGAGVLWLVRFTLYSARVVFILQNMKRVLAPGGVIATQGECLWLHLPLIKSVMNACTELFASVDYAFTTVPSYPSGQIGFIVASTEERGAHHTLLQAVL